MNKKKHTKKEDICMSHSLSITETPPCCESYKLFTSKEKHKVDTWPDLVTPDSK